LYYSSLWNVNEGIGSVYFNQLPPNYTLPEIYTIEVVVTGTNSRGYGLQTVTQNEKGLVGQFLISSESSNLELNNSYIKQNSRTTSGLWIFEWLSSNKNS
tara:strand:- start:135 stop:434 length:300 start_codon:yes stop_codon:yes gene_type:complete